MAAVVRTALVTVGGGNGGMPRTTSPSTIVEYFEPIVVTWKPGTQWVSAAAAAPTTTSAISGAGILLMNRGMTTSRVTVTNAVPTSYQLTLPA